MIIFILFVVTSAQATPRQRIWSWWQNQASTTKPIKCQLNPQYQEPLPLKIQETFLDSIKNPEKIFLSRSCQENETSSPFTFRGKYKDGKFEGPGKWRSKLKFDDDAESAVTNDTCIDKQDGIIEVVGNFKNGALHGQGKVVYKSGKMIIGQFFNGSLDGLMRTFHNQTLKDYKYQMINSRYKGDVWELQDDNVLLYVKSYAFFNQLELDQDEPTAILIPENDTDNIYAGHFNPSTFSLENVSIVEIEQIMDDFCVPELKVKIVQKQDYFLKVPGMTKAYLSNELLCKGPLQNEGNVEKQFQAWNDHYQVETIGYYDIFKTVLQFKPQKIPFDKGLVKQPLMSNVAVLTADDGSIQVNMSIWNGPITTWTTPAVRFDADLQFHGFCGFFLDKIYWNTTGRHDFLGWSPKAILGMFKHGKLQGYGTIITWKEQGLVATFQDGELHGNANMFGTAAILDAEARGAYIRQFAEGPVAGCGFLGHFVNGQVYGNFWVQMLNGGWLHGQANKDGQLSGDDIIHIYPDGQTALKGHFENGFMRKAFNVDVQEYSCDDNGLLNVKQVSDPLSDTVFKYEPCNSTSFGFMGAPDPYEMKNVKLAQSSIPNSGEGVILLKDLPKDHIACYYSLFMYLTPDEFQLFKQNHSRNMSKTEDYRRECSKYTLGTFSYRMFINLPPELDINPLPNLGPKVNHDFTRNNSVYLETEHPMWGLIQTVTPLKDLKAGDELFTYYGYEEKKPSVEGNEDVFPWYFEELMRLERDKRLKKKLSKKSKKKKKAGKNNGGVFV